MDYLSAHAPTECDRPRGASGYEYENCRAAFRRAIMLDADGVELDIHVTRDGAIVASSRSRSPGGRTDSIDVTGRGMPARESRNGETLPMLSEVLNLLHDRDVWIELKTLPPAHEKSLFEVLDAGPCPARYAVHSFDHRIIRRLGEARPDLRRGILLPPTSTTRSRQCAPSGQRRSGRNGSRSTWGW